MLLITMLLALGTLLIVAGIKNQSPLTVLTDQLNGSAPVAPGA